MLIRKKLKILKYIIEIVRYFLTLYLKTKNIWAMRYILVLLLSVLLSFQGYSQKVISGKSNKLYIDIDPHYKRGLPPNLYVDMVFEDENNNGILEALEKAELKMKITNKGAGKAQGLNIIIKSDIYDSDLKIKDGINIPYLMPDQTVEISIPITAGINIKSNEYKLEISVKEYFGYDMDPAYLFLNTMAFRKPDLEFSGLEIVDLGKGALKQDAKLQAGEMVKVKLIVQNVGKNVSENTSYNVYTTDDNIYIDDKSGDLGDIKIGEVKEFWVTVSPNKRVENTGNLPIYLTVNNKYDIGEISTMQIPLKLDQSPPEKNIVTVEPDIDRLQKQVARFEINSDKITANVGKFIDINQVPRSKTLRNSAIAIVIGVEDYDNFVPAPYADNDAELMTEYFKNVLGINKVYTYTNDDVSGFFFDNTFNPDFGELQKAIAKDKTEVFVYYSGHGMPSKDGSNVYLFPSDGRIEALERQGYNLNNFYNNLESLGAKSVTVFMDACFSGASRTSEAYETENLIAMKGIKITPKIKQPWEENPNFTVFTSSDFNETSLGFDPSETGLFTYYLCAGLQGKADKNSDQKITLGELKEYVIENVKETSVKISGLQTPRFFGNENTVIVEY